jgi:hypothetical protein
MLTTMDDGIERALLDMYFDVDGSTPVVRMSRYVSFSGVRARWGNAFAQQLIAL